MKLLHFLSYWKEDVDVDDIFHASFFFSLFLFFSLFPLPDLSLLSCVMMMRMVMKEWKEEREKMEDSLCQEKGRKHTWEKSGKNREESSMGKEWKE